MRPFTGGITIPVLIDSDHVLTELYAISNVPTVIWIDEHDQIVRPNGVAFSADTFKEFTGVEAGPHLDAVRGVGAHGRGADHTRRRTSGRRRSHRRRGAGAVALPRRRATARRTVTTPPPSVISLRPGGWPRATSRSAAPRCRSPAATRSAGVHGALLGVAGGREPVPRPSRRYRVVAGRGFALRRRGAARVDQAADAVLPRHGRVEPEVVEPGDVERQ